MVCNFFPIPCWEVAVALNQLGQLLVGRIIPTRRKILHVSVTDASRSRYLISGVVGAACRISKQRQLVYGIRRLERLNRPQFPLFGSDQINVLYRLKELMSKKIDRTFQFVNRPFMPSGTPVIIPPRRKRTTESKEAEAILCSL